MEVWPGDSHLWEEAPVERRSQLQTWLLGYERQCLGRRRSRVVARSWEIQVDLQSHVWVKLVNPSIDKYCLYECFPDFTYWSCGFLCISHHGIYLESERGVDNRCLLQT